jgi:transposase InsO family protein
MTIMDLLDREHRNIERLLDVLEHELEIFDRGERPDYEVIRAILAYFEVHTAVYHHPQEDRVFAHLKLRDPAAAVKLSLKHIFTRPYRPQTNGKAERFIQTALREWAYARAYDTSDQRAKDLPIWLHHYNWHRPHGSLKSKPPISRLALHEDDLLRFHS